MTEKKFDEADRRAVIKVVQEHLRIALAPVGSRRKWLQDMAGRSYWILGGYGEWHGIAEDMMEAESSRPTGGSIVVATRRRESLRIYIGPLEPFVRNKKLLYRAAKTTGQYQFTFTEREPRLHINQIPGIALHELASVQYTDDAKARDEVVRTATKLLDGLPPEDRERLLQELRSKK